MLALCPLCDPLPILITAKPLPSLSCSHFQLYSPSPQSLLYRAILPCSDLPADLNRAIAFFSLHSYDLAPRENKSFNLK